MTENANLVCRHCGGRDLHRLRRAGFLQEVIYPYFGYYPWVCGTCSSIRLFRMRGKRAKRPPAEAPKRT